MMDHADTSRARRAAPPFPAAGGAARLFDTLLAQHGLKNDAALCRAADISPAVLSKMRNGRARVSADTMLRLHETFGMPFARQRMLMGCDSHYPQPAPASRAAPCTR